VTGASGVLGRSLLWRPAARAYRIRGTTRRRVTPVGAPEGLQWRRANLATGEGIHAALAGVDTVVHAASDAHGDTRATDVEGTARLVHAARLAGAQHFIYVSIIGVDRVPLAYYRHKAAAEHAVQSGEVPWTIVRGTQFHDFIDVLCRKLSRFPIAFAPAGFLVQPIHVDAFADAVWQCVARGPVRQVTSVAGPDVLTFADILRAWMHAQGRVKPLLSLPLPGRVAAAVRRGELTARDHAVHGVTWDEWLQSKYGGAPVP
jgi:uncharacterized protein YbjT (DUF2867 family)